MRLLGLWGGDLDFRLPGALPAAAGAAAALPRSRSSASRGASTCRSRGIELAALAKSYGLTQATRFVNLLEVGRQFPRHDEGARARATFSERGFEVELQIPIFDFGEVRVAASRSRPTCRPSTG